jgi:hypothetical protein
MSGLNHYALSTGEDLFLKTVSADFDRNQALTEYQEERLGNLYKEKSKLIPNKKADHFSLKKSNPQKTRPRMRQRKAF